MILDVCMAGVHKFFQKPRSHIKLQGARTVPWNRFRIEDSDTLGAALCNLVALSPWRPGFVHPWYNVLHEVYTAVNVRIVMLWVLTPCRLVSGYQRFWGSCCLRRASQIPSSASRGVTTQHPSNPSLYSVLSVKNRVSHPYDINRQTISFLCSYMCVCACVRQCLQFYVCLCVTQHTEVVVKKSGPTVLIQEARYWTECRWKSCADDSHCLPSKWIHKIVSQSIYAYTNIINFQQFIHNHSVIYT